jgi:hypothetical protein
VPEAELLGKASATHRQDERDPGNGAATLEHQTSTLI